MAEMVRAVASRLFAQANIEGGEAQEKANAAVHRGALAAQVLKIFGALFDVNAPEFSVSWIVDLLVQLDDLADIGFGYYLPRESRVVRLTENWGRIAGGLPLEAGEYADEGFKPLRCDTIGRVVKMEPDFAAYDEGTEYSDVFRCAGESTDCWFANLCDRLPEQHASPPPEETTYYYNPEIQRSRTRGDRWQKKFPGFSIVLARTGVQPAHYSIYLRKPDRRGPSWFEVTHEDYRMWVLLVERLAATTNRIPVKAGQNCTSIMLPDMLPRAWNSALFSCASTVVAAENGWTLVIQDEARELADTLLRRANIQVI
jgi:hypothetical protein